MKSRRLLAWVMILTLVAGAWILSNRLDQRHQEEEDQATRLLPAGQVAEAQVLELKGQDYPQPLRLEREGQGWWVTQPLSCPADSLAVGRILNALAMARINQRLDNPGPRADFGLEPPRLELVLTNSQGQCSTRLAPAELRSALAKTLLELRDKSVLDFNLAQVRRVEIKEAGQTQVLERAEGQAEATWTLVGLGPADPQEVDNLLLQAHGMQAQDFIDKDFKPHKLGLEPPQGLILLAMADGSQRGLAWGQGVEGKNQTYARRLEGGPLLLVQTVSLRRLERGPQDLLDRRLFTLPRDQARHLTIAGPEGKSEYVRKDGQWRRLSPPGGPQEGQAAELLVWELLDLKWHKPLPAGQAGQAGLDPPRLTLTLAGAPGQSQSLELGQPGPEGLIAARRAGDKAIYGLNPGIMDKIPGMGAAPAPAAGEQDPSARK